MIGREITRLLGGQPCLGFGCLETTDENYVAQFYCGCTVISRFVSKSRSVVKKIIALY